MFDKNNSFEAALPCRPRICLSSTLRSNLFQRPPDIISRFRVTCIRASTSTGYPLCKHLLGWEPGMLYYGNWSLRQLLLFTRIPLQVSHYRLFQRTVNFFTKPKPCYITILKHTSLFVVAAAERHRNVFHYGVHC